MIDNKILLPIGFTHDIIKVYLDRYNESFFELCRTIPEVKKSRIFAVDTPYKLYHSYAESMITSKPADVVWFLKTDNPGYKPYRIIHEIKTGSYDIKQEIRKHYCNDTHVQFWIWGGIKEHKQNKIPIGYRNIKQIDITRLFRFINELLRESSND
jgi:hypothetical protein